MAACKGYLARGPKYAAQAAYDNELHGHEFQLKAPLASIMLRKQLTTKVAWLFGLSMLHKLFAKETLHCHYLAP